MRIKDQKAELRKQMLKVRAAIKADYKQEYDAWVCDKIWSIIKEKEFSKVHCYLPMGMEIDIKPLINKMLENNIVLITPKTLGKRQLQNLYMRSLDELENGIFGTQYPAFSKEYLGDYDLIIVPGLAFNSENDRLGYGGGYYDNFIIDHPEAFTLGIFYPFQKCDYVPIEAHDVKLDDVLCKDDFL